MSLSFLKGKKVLIVGLGRLGGGVATAKFLLRKRAKVTITDLKTKADLRDSVQELRGKNIKFVLGQHRKADFKQADIIVFNPAVSVFSQWVKLAQKLEKPIENDLTLFLREFKERFPGKDYLAVTGTRGKTTTATWLAHLLKPAVLGGNIPETGFLRVLPKISKYSGPLVLELSSFQLEFMAKGMKPPRVAVITNLFNDHLNRYGTQEAYANFKANIFSNQRAGDFLILNADDPWHPLFLRKKPQSKVYYVSLKRLGSQVSGLFFIEDRIFFKEGRSVKSVGEIKGLSPHFKLNLLSALLAARVAGRTFEELFHRVMTLPVISFRQEIILNRKDIVVINDTTATSPDATITALERFSPEKDRLFLITGGTDKKLEFGNLAKKIKENVSPQRLFLIQGSATQVLVKELDKLKYFRQTKPQLFDNLKSIILGIKLSRASRKFILFSPASASFEKFKNEFDRGKQFNALARRFLGGSKD